MGALLSGLSRVFATPRGFACAAACYCIGHYLWRVSSSSALGRDDVEQALFAQHWALTYDPAQPPLYTWLLRSLVDMTGIAGVPVHALIKAIFVFLGLVAMRAAAELLLRRQCAQDGGDAGSVLASLAAAFPLLTVVLGWDMLQLYTHTVLLFAAMPALLWALLRLDPALRQARAGWVDYVLLGLVLGLGLLSKYSFPLFALALSLAALGDRGLRRVIWRSRFFLALGVALAIAGPHYGAVLTAPEAFRAAAEAAIGLPSELTAGDIVLASLDSLFSAVLAFLALPVIVLILCLPPWRRPWRRAGPEVQSGSILLERLFAVCGLVWFIGAIVLGSGRVQPHHLVVPLLFLPLWYLLSGPNPCAVARTRMMVAVIGVTGLAAVALPVKHLTEVSVYDCRRCYLHRPYDAIAEQIREAGFRGGTVVANERLLGGGLLPFLQDGLVLSAEDPWFRPRQQRRGQCLLVWTASDNSAQSGMSSAIPQRILDFAQRTLALAVAEDATVAWAQHPYATQQDRLFTVGFVPVEGGDLCAAD